MEKEITRIKILSAVIKYYKNLFNAEIFADYNYGVEGVEWIKIMYPFGNLVDTIYLYTDEQINDAYNRFCK